MTSKERGASGRLHIAVLAALQVAILAAVPTSAVGNGRLIDETRLDGIRELQWTASSPFGGLVVVASCLLDEIQESDRLRLRFRWRNMPEKNEGEAILFKVDEGPVQELAARMADDGSIEVLSAAEVISQLIDAEEFVFGVRGAGGAIVQRDGRSTGALDEGLYTLEAFRSRCLNPDQPRARQNRVSGTGDINGPGRAFRIGVADNGDMVLQTNPLLVNRSDVLSNDAVRFRCLSEPQNWGGQRWSAGTMILAIPRSFVSGRNQQTALVSFDEEEPQGIVMSQEYTTAEALSISSIKDRHWTIGDASQILAKALVSERMFVRSRFLFVGDPAVEVFIDRARRQGCYNNIAAQQPEVPATSENGTPAQTPAQTPTQTPTRITDDNIPFIYESRAEAPAPEGELMERISSDYSRFMSDEFARRDLEQQIRPILDGRLLEARAITRVTVEFGSDLGGYDFERSGFPTNHNESNYVPFLGPYAVRFSNAADLSFVPVAEDFARDLVSSMRNNRAISIGVTGTIVSVEQSVSTGKTVYVLAEQVDVALTSGASVGTLEL